MNKAEYGAVNFQQGDIGDHILKCSDGAPITTRAPTEALPQESLPSPAKQGSDIQRCIASLVSEESTKGEDFDIQRSIASWFREQYNQALPWDQFADAAKLSMPKSAQEFSDRMSSNVRLFLRNYGILFVTILAGYVMTSAVLVVSFAVVVAVCAALKLHQNDESVAVLGTTLTMNKNHRLTVAASVAVLFLIAADIRSAIVWSAGTTLAIGTIHATFYQGNGFPNVVEKLPDTAGEGDGPIHATFSRGLGSHNFAKKVPDAAGEGAVSFGQ